MKKLFALAIVAGMVFVGCNQKPEEQVEQVNEDQIETIQEDQQEAIDMPEEEATEEVAE